MIRLAILLTVLAAPVAAQTVALPGGCEAYVTVQKRSCSVSTLFICEMDEPGLQRRMDFDEETMTYMGMIDAETQWIESFHVLAGSTERLAPGAADPASFSELIETGYNRWDFSTVSDPYAETVYRGDDRLTGEVIEIDGVILEETEFSVTAYDPGGNWLWDGTGTEYINREWRTFLSGTRTVTLPDEVFETDRRPVSFAFPGDPGFMSTQPQYDCGVMLSKGVSQ